MGTVCIFGMQYWNEEVTKENCTYMETQFLGYHIIKNRSGIREIAVDCSDGERYFIDGVSVNAKLKEDLSEMDENDNVEMLIHPNGATIVELLNNDIVLLSFEDSIDKLNKEVSGFLYIGIFMYFCSSIGLVNIVINMVKKIKSKKSLRSFEQSNGEE